MAEYIIVTMDNCVFCDRAKALLTAKGKTYREVNVMDVPEVGALNALVGRNTMPLILQVVGGFDELLLRIG